MNREQIIQMAHESYLDVYGLGKDYAKFADALEAFAKLVAEHEREACAKVCDDKNTLLAWPTYAAAIRARGQA